MNVLITGVGSSGKSTLRKKLANILGCPSADLDYDKISVLEHSYPIVEDVRATTENVLILNRFDLIIYVLPSRFSHTIFWIKRMWRCAC